MFSVIVGLLPLWWAWLHGAHEFKSVLSKGDGFAIVGVLAAASIGELIGSEGPGQLVSVILGGASLLVLIGSVAEFAEATGIGTTAISQHVALMRSVYMLIAVVLAGGATMAVTTEPGRPPPH